MKSVKVIYWPKILSFYHPQPLKLEQILHRKNGTQLWRSSAVAKNCSKLNVVHFSKKCYHLLKEFAGQISLYVEGNVSVSHQVSILYITLTS